MILNIENFASETVTDGTSFVFLRDYQAIPALDRYDMGDLDESDYDAISEAGRREAERLMRRRDEEMGLGNMRRGLFLG